MTKQRYGNKNKITENVARLNKAEGTILGGILTLFFTLGITGILIGLVIYLNMEIWGSIF